MSNIEIYRVASRGGVARQVGRALSRIDAEASVRVAKVDAQAAVQAAKIDVVLLTTQRAMQGTALVSQLEQQLGQAVPLAVTRLQAISDLATLAMGQIIADTVTKLQRP